MFFSSLFSQVKQFHLLFKKFAKPVVVNLNFLNFKSVHLVADPFPPQFFIITVILLSFWKVSVHLQKLPYVNFYLMNPIQK